MRTAGAVTGKHGTKAETATPAPARTNPRMTRTRLGPRAGSPSAGMKPAGGADPRTGSRHRSSRPRHETLLGAPDRTAAA